VESCHELGKRMMNSTSQVITTNLPVMSNLNTNLNAAASDGHGVRETHTLVLNQASPDIISSAVEANESSFKNLVSSLCEGLFYSFTSK
jgi:hypothetical protein